MPIKTGKSYLLQIDPIIRCKANSQCLLGIRDYHIPASLPANKIRRIVKNI